MFRTMQMHSDAGMIESRNLDRMMSQFQIDFFPNDRDAVPIFNAWRTLSDEYKVGHETNEQNLDVVLRGMEAIADFEKFSEREDCLAFSHLCLERMAFPGHDEPYIPTLGGKFWQMFKKPMLPVNQENLILMDSTVEDAPKFFELLERSQAFLIEGVKNTMIVTMRELMSVAYDEDKTIQTWNIERVFLT